jgi:hypothetical protein
MATRPIVPRANGEGSLGVNTSGAEKYWGGVFTNRLNGADAKAMASYADSSMREANTAYVSGTKKFAAGLPANFVLVCTGAGVTANADITLPATIADGATFADGTVTWTMQENVTTEVFAFRQPSTAVTAASIVFCPGLPSGFYLECKVAGTTDAGAITLPATIVENAAVTDGTVTWEIRKIADTQGLATKANITGSNLVHHRDVITTSGTYTAPVTALYKITVKGGGGGGSKGTAVASTYARSGAGGGEGGTTIAYNKMIAGQTASVVIGAGGTGATTNAGDGENGGNSTVIIDSTTFTGGGGQGGQSVSSGGDGGTGTIPGACGSSTNISSHSGDSAVGPSGGGSGSGSTATFGAGGRGGSSRFVGSTVTVNNGVAGGDGYVWFEYYTPGA